MKYLFLSIVVFFSSIGYGWGATDTGALAPNFWAENLSLEDLSLNTVKVMDDMHIRVVFTEAVEIESITLTLSQQSDNSTLRIKSITWVVDAPEAVDVTLEDTLDESTSYSVTAIAAVGVSGSTITDGALAIKDFVTPVPLKKSQVVLSAPPNPNAVIVKTWSTDVKPKPTEVPKKETPTPTEELPLTGMNPLFLLIIILPLTFFLLRRRAH